MSVTRNSVRRLFSDDLDTAIVSAKLTDAVHDLEILLSERSRRIQWREAQRMAVAELWDAYGIDVDDLRNPNGSLSYRVGGQYVSTQGGTTANDLPAVLYRQPGNARTRRWFGGLDSLRYCGSPAAALLAALREGFAPLSAV